MTMSSRNHHKGPGYDPVAAVVEAIAKTGWTPQAFFINATLHTRQNGFDVKAAAASFERSAAEPGMPYDELPRVVITFADWVLTKEPKQIRQKYTANPPH